MSSFISGVFEHSKEYREIAGSLGEGVSPLYIHSISKEYSAIVSSALQSGEGGLIVTWSDSEAKYLYELMSDFDENVLYFPPKEIEFFEVFAQSHVSSVERSKVLNRLSSGERFTVVLSIDALLGPVQPKSGRSGAISLRTGESVSMDTVASSLVEMGFARVDMVESPGQFSVRGGILDIFPIEMENGVRVEFFGDEIDSIRIFDVTDQLSISNADSATIMASSESVMTSEERNRLTGRISEVLQELKGGISPRLEESLRGAVESLENGLYTSDTLERYSVLVSDGQATIVDYMSPRAVISFIDPSRIYERYESIKRDFYMRFSELLQAGSVLHEQERYLVDFDELRFSLVAQRIVAFDLLKKDPRMIAPQETINFSSMDPPEFYGKTELLREDLENWKYRGFKVFISVSSEERAKKLMDDLASMGSFSTYLGDASELDVRILSGQSVIISSGLPVGAVFPSFKTVFITEKEIFGTGPARRRKKSKTSRERVIRSFNELSDGDLVVHESHGVGRYEGTVALKIENVRKDYLKIRYSGEDYLYIPVEQMDVLSKYIGDDESVKLSKLGGIDWKKAKSKARKSIEDITDDLVKLYADRKSAKGFEFSKDTTWQSQFEEAFPYVETEDQMKCIQEIKEDMEKPQVMDRLLCGDVGYGKTEVAIRAIFKAVNDSKQAAVLVPTTILAQQHFTNMSDRFSKFPVRVEMVSRFRTKKQTEKILADLKAGIIDVIVGTHRLLSNDVVFKDLGLLVVDEEQRFGVKHKEAIKKMKTGVDVLTMTATPIPRTLHMSLSGVRDMSVIEDPPEDRFPIQTYVTEYDEEIVREAILRETSRGGQVFFVHNQVRDIDAVAKRLGEMMPELDVEYAHGQMTESRLEKIMMGFIRREFDVLVATTIVETGLDISNANTIIINNADRMGLSQLYQLRGRVGRSNRVAYAYLMYKKDKSLTEVAEKRLKAIKEFTELGAGFRIAMRDLELRGAGNLLGAQQHGHIASVGYELYCQMIEETVSMIKGEPRKAEKPDTLIELPVDAYIPDSLITVGEHRLDMYKRIAAIDSRADISSVQEEISDRFGSLPDSVNNLLYVSYMRSIGQRVGAISIRCDEKGVIVKLSVDAPITPEAVTALFESFGQSVRVVPGKMPHIRYFIDMKKTGMNVVMMLTVDMLEKIASVI